MFPKEGEKGKRVLRRHIWKEFLKAASRTAVSRSPGKKKRDTELPILWRKPQDRIAGTHRIMFGSFRDAGHQK